MFLIDMFNKKTTMPTPETALPGRDQPLPTAEIHFTSGRPLKGPYPEGLKTIYLGMGCFWGAERLLWNTPGVWVTAAGYQGGITPNPTYQETCTGLTGHTEVVKVVYDPKQVTLEALLKIFFEAHDPTQGMRQGNDIGTTYRSAIYADTPDDIDTAIRMRDAFQEALIASGRKTTVTTEIAAAGPFYYAEDYHQQYLAKNPDGYCGLRGTGVSCPIAPAA
ncbi:peptide-methionine (S)-S-oxide reductase MsrA [Rhizobium sp. S95]|uniref:Peptide methionine sulfoxide reductase MsrA n=1 Tax=Ciceribacter sichuanensis TaxID=2949647 RepID=A0AAJ1BX08_9HYPH|nr:MULTISPECIES: peptide-methionine (S)-S-oxide reductase MsrA [unclassified Ciceribacter]MCM2397073.1 peptide-methionine (S)-S-oxide reductase MsrA [Ciceribacter sp. S95]MCM2401461.1 peptide-methionine (S)-S-oxide reductase MsrA [Ciceribacter sp. S153]MCO5957835.1 peptide-methionine (S)-S-oxide reductase MsrA [Ciceribacter sp. S101]